MRIPPPPQHWPASPLPRSLPHLIGDGGEDPVIIVWAECGVDVGQSVGTRPEQDPQGYVHILQVLRPCTKTTQGQQSFKRLPVLLRLYSYTSILKVKKRFPVMFFLMLWIRIRIRIGTDPHHFAGSGWVSIPTSKYMYCIFDFFPENFNKISKKGT